MSDERGGTCIRCGGGPLQWGHLEGTSGVPVLFWAGPDKQAAVGVIPVWACTQCGFLEMYIDPEKLKRQMEPAE